MPILKEVNKNIFMKRRCIVAVLIVIIMIVTLMVMTGTGYYILT